MTACNLPRPWTRVNRGPSCFVPRRKNRRRHPHRCFLRNLRSAANALVEKLEEVVSTAPSRCWSSDIAQEAYRCCVVFVSCFISLPGISNPRILNTRSLCRTDWKRSPWNSTAWPLSATQGMHSWPLLVHYCDTCHYNTPLPYSPGVFTEEHNCTHVRAAFRGQPSPSPY